MSKFTLIDPLDPYIVIGELHISPNYGDSLFHQLKEGVIFVVKPVFDKDQSVNTLEIFQRRLANE